MYNKKFLKSQNELINVGMSETAKKLIILCLCALVTSLILMAEFYLYRLLRRSRQCRVQ